MRYAARNEFWKYDEQNLSDRERGENLESNFFFLFTFFILPMSLTLGRFTARNEEHLSLSLPPDLGGGGGHGHGDVKLTSESTGNYKTRERAIEMARIIQIIATISSLLMFFCSGSGVFGSRGMNWRMTRVEVAVEYRR